LTVRVYRDPGSPWIEKRTRRPMTEAELKEFHRTVLPEAIALRCEQREVPAHPMIVIAGGEVQFVDGPRC
jgi:hypothetical protein